MKYFSPMVFLFVLLTGCVTPPEEVSKERFTRTSLLLEAIEEDFTAGEWGPFINTVQYGYDRQLLTGEERAGYLRRYVEKMYEMYRVAIENGEYGTALAAQGNITFFSERAAAVNMELPPGTVRSRDDLILEWAEHLRENGEEVLALYRILRRSHLGDIPEEVLLRYIDIARRYNHDEGLSRFILAAERMNLTVPPAENDLASPDDEPAVMLPGTVTVWVNKGIRIQEGVGVPDRVIGSGFFVDPRGFILTNYHVIESEVDPTYEGFSRLFIKLPGRPDERVPARVVGYDRIFDLALLKVEIDPSYVFSLSDTRELEPGERVFALGSPGGLDSTITSGIVSAAGRRFLQMGDAIQVDVPINPGNSGGPLVLPEGQVAGVVFAGLQQFEGINFAIPSYWIRHFFPELFREGEVVHPWLGISVRETSEGLEVIYVKPDSPAGDAGVSAGDVLLQISNDPVKKIARAQDHILGNRVGSVVDTLWKTPPQEGSENQERPSPEDDVRRYIALGPRPFSPVEEALERQPIESLFPVLFGITVEDVGGTPWGPDYVITEVYPGSIADESSLSVDDPFALRNWKIDEELRAAFIQIIIKKKKAGFIESGVQLGAYLETDSFL